MSIMLTCNLSCNHAGVILKELSKTLQKNMILISPQRSLLTLLLITSITTLSNPQFILAQTAAPEEVRGDWYLSPVNTLEGVANCFDYYKFGSLQVQLAPPDISKVPAGEKVTFSGTITNNNSYPIVDGQIYVKIFKKDVTDGDVIRLKGYPIVDFFQVTDNLSVDALAEKPVSFDWLVPDSAAGEYQAVFFVTSAHRFNLLGLTFTDDVVGNRTDFTIVNDTNTPAPVTFDKTKITLNEEVYNPIAFLTRVEKETPVTITVPVTNPSNSEKKIRLAWVTTAWDGILPQDKLEKEGAPILIKAGETINVSYEVPTLSNSITFVQGIVSDGDAQSIIQVRFVREGFDDIRLNFPSVTAYPLTPTNEVSLFSCLHSTDMSIVPGGTLDLTLRDESGKIIHSYTYSGSVSSAMMGAADKFTPSETFVNFDLEATLRKGDTLVDTVTMSYRCNEINPELCPKDDSQVGTPDSSDTSDSAASTGINTTIYLIAIALALVLAATLIAIRSRVNRHSENTAPEDETTTPPDESSNTTSA